MSADLTWQIVKKSNRYLLRNGTGDRRYFSTVTISLRNGDHNNHLSIGTLKRDQPSLIQEQRSCPD